MVILSITQNKQKNPSPIAVGFCMWAFGWKFSMESSRMKQITGPVNILYNVPKHIKGGKEKYQSFKQS